MPTKNTPYSLILDPAIIVPREDAPMTSAELLRQWRTANFVTRQNLVARRDVQDLLEGVLQDSVHYRDERQCLVKP